MLTIFYTAARISVMVFGWLVALALALAADYMLAGSIWPVFIGLGAWWTLTFILFIRREVEQPARDTARDSWWRYSAGS